MLTRATLLFLIAATALTAADDWNRIAQLPHNSDIRVHTRDSAVHNGQLRSVDSTGIQLTEDGKQTRYPVHQVARVEAKTSSKRARNAVIGAAIGVGTGIVLGFVSCPSCKNENEDEFTKRIGLGAAIGGGAGAAIGMLGGSGYKTIYKSR